MGVERNAGLKLQPSGHVDGCTLEDKVQEG
jgi:hypothetical protein